MRAALKTFHPAYLQKLASGIFQACGAPSADADTVAEHLVAANLMGLDSHGVIRVPQYVQDVKRGAIRPGAPVTLLQETPTTAVVDAGWNFGQVGALRATEVAMKKARANALASVVVHHCRHVGSVGFYPRRAAEQNFVAIAMCSTSGEGHWVCPWGGREGKLGTNPIAFAAPTGGDPILLDFATAMASEGKVRLHLNRSEPLPAGWIVDGKGRPSTDPKDLHESPRGGFCHLVAAKATKDLRFPLWPRS